MNWGDFRQHFRGFAWKQLTPHEVDPGVSNGHEFQGVGRLRTILGTDEAERLPTTYVLLHDESDDVEVLSAWSKWYDARAKNPTRSSEWRLYYPAEAGSIQSRMRAGDLMVLAVTNERQLLILLAAAGSNRERELQVLFGISDVEREGLQVRAFDSPIPMDFVTATILEQLGLGRVEVPTGGDGAIVSRLIDEIEAEYPEQLPPGKTIAALIRSWITVDEVGQPDDALGRWIEAEAAVYRGWEDRKIARRLLAGFLLENGGADVDAFRRFSMGLRQSRVSRAGGALQYHFRALLDAWHIRYEMEPEIDGGEIPDFLFPSANAYNDATFPRDQLRMLAAKFTAKDRWRQVLNEAEQIRDKHLLTLEAAISGKQMNLMQRARLTLVMPTSIGGRYPAPYGERILSVRAFLAELAELQRSVAARKSSEAQ